MLNILKLENLEKDPIVQFSQWFHEAKSTLGIRYPDAFCLSTLDLQGFPDGRMLLLKEFSSDGFTFFTNSHSRKGQSLAANNKASMTFYWDALQRQVRIKGKVGKISELESDAYFQSRGYLSQIGAWASNQSKILDSRLELEQRVENYKSQFANNHVPRPDYWVGYLLTPETIEFWQERPARLHDRFEYFKVEENVWKIQRLSP